MPRRSLLYLCRRAPAVGLRHWRRHRLGADYRRGRNADRAAHAEQVDPRIVATGRQLRQQLIDGHAGRHSAANYRVLMLRPGSITAEIWFGDLERCLRHTGVDCLQLLPTATTAQINEAIERFHPNVFIAAETTEALQVLDLDRLRRHKQRHGCLRLFVPVWHAGAPGRHSTPELDAWRRKLRWQGFTADAHFTIFEPEFHERFSHDREGPAIECVTVPQGCNPFTDYPVPAAKHHDYFMATSMSDERVEVSYRFLRPILGRYRGLWAGPRWGFGLERIPPSEMPQRYAETRIALSPLVGFVHRHGAELTHRIYAAAACGAFQLTMPTPVTRRFFDENELVTAATPAEYRKLFDHFVDRPAERNAIALAALQRAYAAHTCLHRVDQLVSHWDRWRARGYF